MDRGFSLSEILTQIPTAFFAQSERLKCDKSIVSVEVITTTQYYNEGDWWALALLSMNHPDGTNTLGFLPIETVQKDLWAPSPARTRRIAFGVVTESPYQGEVDLLAYDAFRKLSFAETLLRHFWTYQGFYACSTLSESDDEISFTTSLETTVDSLITALEHKIARRIHGNGDVEITCGPLTLIVPRVPGDLPPKAGVGMEEVGRIEYKAEDYDVAIGFLYQQQ